MPLPFDIKRKPPGQQSSLLPSIEAAIAQSKRESQANPFTLTGPKAAPVPTLTGPQPQRSYLKAAIQTAMPTSPQSFIQQAGSSIGGLTSRVGQEAGRIGHSIEGAVKGAIGGAVAQSVTMDSLLKARANAQDFVDAIPGQTAPIVRGVKNNLDTNYGLVGKALGAGMAPATAMLAGARTPTTSDDDKVDAYGNRLYRQVQDEWEIKPGVGGDPNWGAKYAKRVYRESRGNPSDPRFYNGNKASLQDIMGAYDTNRELEGRPHDPAARFQFKRAVMVNRREGMYAARVAADTSGIAYQPDIELEKFDKETFGVPTRGDKEAAKAGFMEKHPEAAPGAFEPIWQARDEFAQEALGNMESLWDSQFAAEQAMQAETYIKEWANSSLKGQLDSAEGVIDPLGLRNKFNASGAGSSNGKGTTDSLGMTVGQWLIKSTGGVKSLAEANDLALVGHSLTAALTPISSAISASTGMVGDEQALWLRTAGFVGDLGANVATGFAGAAVGPRGVMAGATLIALLKGASTEAAKAAVINTFVKGAITKGLGISMGSHVFNFAPQMLAAGNGDLARGAHEVGLGLAQLFDPAYYKREDVSWEDKAYHGMTAAALILGLGYGVKQGLAKIKGIPTSPRGPNGGPAGSAKGLMRQVAGFLAKAAELGMNTGEASGKGSMASIYAQVLKNMEDAGDAGLVAAVHHDIRVGKEAAAHLVDRKAFNDTIAQLSELLANETDPAEILRLKGAIDVASEGLLAHNNKWEAMQVAVLDNNGNPVLDKQGTPVTVHPDFYEAGPVDPADIKVRDALKASKLNSPNIAVRALAHAKLTAANTIGMHPIISAVFGEGTPGHAYMVKMLTDETINAHKHSYAVANAIREFVASVPFAKDGTARMVMQEYARLQHQFYDNMDAGAFTNATDTMARIGATTPEEFLPARLKALGYSDTQTSVLVDQINEAVTYGRTIMSSAASIYSQAEILKGVTEGKAQGPRLALDNGHRYYWSQAYERAGEDSLRDQGFIGSNRGGAPPTPGQSTLDQPVQPAAPVSARKTTSYEVRSSLNDTHTPLDGLDTLVKYADDLMANVAHTPKQMTMDSIARVHNADKYLREGDTRIDQATGVVRAAQSTLLQSMDRAIDSLNELHKRTTMAVTQDVVTRAIGVVAGNVLAFSPTTVAAQAATLQNLVVDISPRHLAAGVRMAEQYLKGTLDTMIDEHVKFLDSQVKGMPSTNPSRTATGKGPGNNQGRPAANPFASARTTGMTFIQAIQGGVDRLAWFSYLSEGMQKFGGDMAKAEAHANQRFTALYPRVQGMRSPMYEGQWKAFTVMTGEPFYQMMHLGTSSSRAMWRSVSKPSSALSNLSKLVSMVGMGHLLNMLTRPLTGNSYAIVDPIGDFQETNSALNLRSSTNELQDGKYPDPMLPTGYNSESQRNYMIGRSALKTGVNAVANTPFGALLLGEWKNVDETSFRAATTGTQGTSGQTFLSSIALRTFKSAKDFAQNAWDYGQAKGDRRATEGYTENLLQAAISEGLQMFSPAVPGGAQLSKWALASRYMKGQDVGNAATRNERNPLTATFQTDASVFIGGVSNSPEARQARADKIRGDYTGL